MAKHKNAGSIAMPPRPNAGADPIRGGAIVAMVACNTDESSTTDVVPAPHLGVERELLRGLFRAGNARVRAARNLLSTCSRPNPRSRALCCSFVPIWFVRHGTSFAPCPATWRSITWKRSRRPFRR